MLYRWIKIVAITAAIAFVGTACGSDDDNKSDASAPAVTVSPDVAAIVGATEAQTKAINNAAAALAGTPPTDASAPADGTATTVVTTPAAAGSPAECISTTEMNKLVGSDVQRVGGEACAYTLRVAALGNTPMTCAGVLICTLSFSDGVRVYKGDGKAHTGVIAGTVRHVASYPSGDAVHKPCELTGKEHRFGQAQRPPFPVTPGNFSC